MEFNSPDSLLFGSVFVILIHFKWLFKRAAMSGLEIGQLTVDVSFVRWLSSVVSAAVSTGDRLVVTSWGQVRCILRCRSTLDAHWSTGFRISPACQNSACPTRTLTASKSPLVQPGEHPRASYRSPIISLMEVEFTEKSSVWICKYIAYWSGVQILRMLRSIKMTRTRRSGVSVRWT